MTQSEQTSYSLHIYTLIVIILKILTYDANVLCVLDACTKLVIDLGLELVILYEHIYEIYGDIQGAPNNFKIEQGKHPILLYSRRLPLYLSRLVKGLEV